MAKASQHQVGEIILSTGRCLTSGSSTTRAVMPMPSNANFVAVYATEQIAQTSSNSTILNRNKSTAVLLDTASGNLIITSAGGAVGRTIVAKATALLGQSQFLAGEQGDVITTGSGHQFLGSGGATGYASFALVYHP